jgi:hypothetical protein
LFTACTGDGTAASDEGAGGLSTRAVHERTFLVVAHEKLLLLFLFMLLLLTFLKWKNMLILNVKFAWLLSVSEQVRVYKKNIKKTCLLLACTGDGKASSDEGADGLPTSSVHEGIVVSCCC